MESDKAPKRSKGSEARGAFHQDPGRYCHCCKPDPRAENNPRLRTLIETARAASVPNENIERALSRAKEQKELKEFVFECVGPEGCAILVEGITDNSNRTMQHMRTLAQDAGCKPADPGSLLWAFELVDEVLDGVQTRHYAPRFPQPISADAQPLLAAAIEAFDEHEDVQRVATNGSVQ